MLAANIAVAVFLRDQELKFLRRVHASPTRRKIKKLTQFVNLLGFPVENLEDRFQLKALLESVHETPLEHTVTLAVLKSMQKAVYSPEAEGRSGRPLLLPYHFADSTLSRSHDPSHVGGIGIQSASRAGPRANDLVGRALFRAGAAGRDGGTRADETQIVGLFRIPNR